MKTWINVPLFLCHMARPVQMMQIPVQMISVFHQYVAIQTTMILVMICIDCTEADACTDGSCTDTPE